MAGLAGQQLDIHIPVARLEQEDGPSSETVTVHGL